MVAILGYPQHPSRSAIQCFSLDIDNSLYAIFKKNFFTVDVNDVHSA